MRYYALKIRGIGDRGEGIFQPAAQVAGRFQGDAGEGLQALKRGFGIGVHGVQGDNPLPGGQGGIFHQGSVL